MAPPIPPKQCQQVLKKDKKNSPIKKILKKATETYPLILRNLWKHLQIGRAHV